ncbi:unnamed protein product [Oppiella nova]|uniref:PAP-associated domain-containing protein n=1 Tax=Oppiella nova TaxID=334625 RepID=A0A7R9QDA0_9ACAR|nr:unnamed protein product [Oppiella nova]CAG2163009.1 unnamed protein product [Oppiella nova]
MDEESVERSQTRNIQTCLSIEKVYELTLDFLSTDCFRKSAIETCDDIEYKKLRHCAVDFWVDHLEEGLELYRNETIRYGAYSYLIEAKGCLQKSLDEIESAHKLKSIQDGNKCMDTLSMNIWRFYESNTLQYKHFQTRIRHKQQLSYSVGKYLDLNGYRFDKIFISGSTANGLATIDSDIDLCLLMTHFCSFEFRKHQKLSILGAIEKIVRRELDVEDSEVIDARVPILRYIDPKTDIRVEMNVNNEIGIRNTRLLYCYSKLDWRVVPICIAIKRWAKHYQIIDSFSGSLSSYCVQLMVIFYLQNTGPPVLPCLQQTDKHLFDDNADINDYKELPDLDQLTPFKTHNEKSLSQLFVDFFRFYVSVFDFEKHVASVRVAKTLDKQDYTNSMYANQWEYICVEEPFSGDNTARTLYDGSAYDLVLTKFKKIYVFLILDNSPKVSLIVKAYGFNHIVSYGDRLVFPLIQMRNLSLVLVIECFLVCFLVLDIDDVLGQSAPGFDMASVLRQMIPHVPGKIIGLIQLSLLSRLLRNRNRNRITDAGANGIDDDRDGQVDESDEMGMDIGNKKNVMKSEKKKTEKKKSGKKSQKKTATPSSYDVGADGYDDGEEGLPYQPMMVYANTNAKPTQTRFPWLRKILPMSSGNGDSVNEKIVSTDIDSGFGKDSDHIMASPNGFPIGGSKLNGFSSRSDTEETEHEDLSLDDLLTYEPSESEINELLEHPEVLELLTQLNETLKQEEAIKRRKRSVKDLKVDNSLSADKSQQSDHFIPSAPVADLNPYEMQKESELEPEPQESANSYKSRSYYNYYKPLSSKSKASLMSPTVNQMAVTDDNQYNSGTSGDYNSNTGAGMGDTYSMGDMTDMSGMYGGGGMGTSLPVMDLSYWTKVMNKQTYSAGNNYNKPTNSYSNTNTYATTTAPDDDEDDEEDEEDEPKKQHTTVQIINAGKSAANMGISTGGGSDGCCDDGSRRGVRSWMRNLPVNCQSVDAIKLQETTIPQLLQSGGDLTPAATGMSSIDAVRGFIVRNQNWMVPLIASAPAKLATFMTVRALRQQNVAADQQQQQQLGDAEDDDDDDSKYYTYQEIDEGKEFGNFNKGSANSRVLERLLPNRQRGSREKIDMETSVANKDMGASDRADGQLKGVRRLLGKGGKRSFPLRVTLPINSAPLHGRVNIEEEPNNLTVTIRPLHVNDTGWYNCEAFDTTAPIHKSIYVTIQAEHIGDCPTNTFFSCGNRLCIPKRYVCDGFTDCPNDRDESPDLCGVNPCDNKISCEDGRCIAKQLCCLRQLDANCPINNLVPCCADYLEQLVRIDTIVNIKLSTKPSESVFLSSK